MLWDATLNPFVTQGEVMAALEAVEALVSIAKHGKVMFNLDGQSCWRNEGILSRGLDLKTREERDEILWNPVKRIRSLDTRQRDTCDQD